MMKTDTATSGKALCPKCNEVETDTFAIAGRHFPVMCDACDAAMKLEEEVEAQAKLDQARNVYIENEIPRLYCDSDVSRFPATWEQVSQWKGGPRGILLVGDTGKCKTRMLCELVARRHRDTGERFNFMRSSLLAKLVRQQFGDHEPWVAKQKLNRLARVPVLVVDDLGKQASTPVVEEEFFDLIEERVSAGLPLLISANATRAELEAMFSADRGRPLVRRIAEFCETLIVS